MVWHIIRANIFSARIFPRPCGARKNTSQIAKYPHVLYAKPSNKVYIFCVLRCIFPSPAGARKNTSNEQNVRSYYMLNHRIGGLLFHYKKNYLAIGFYFLVRVFRDILILSVRMTLTISKMFARIICQTTE